ncbi:Bax inhibitor 1 [Ranunculus cassubicifolius]
MESFSSFFESSSRGGRWSYESLKNFRQISPTVQNHLKLVYVTLCCALVASAVGVYMHILMNLGGFLSFVGTLGSMIWLLSTPPYEEKKRLFLL